MDYYGFYHQIIIISDQYTMVEKHDTASCCGVSIWEICALHFD